MMTAPLQRLLLVFVLLLALTGTVAAQEDDDVAGEVDLFGGEVDLFGGEVDLFGGEVDLFGGEVDLFGGEVDLFGGEVDLFGGDGSLSGAPLRVASVITQTAERGILQEIEDNTFTLTLLDVPAETTVIQVSPPARLTYNTRDFITNWSFAVSLIAADSGDAVLFAPTEAEAELKAGGTTYYLTIQDATYDIAVSSIEYRVTLTQVIGARAGSDLSLDFASTDAPLLPEAKGDEPVEISFGPATLTISGTDLFWQTLQAGELARLQGTRAVEAHPDCPLAENLLEQAYDALRRIELAAQQLRNNAPDADTDPDERQTWREQVQQVRIAHNRLQFIINDLSAWMRDNACDNVIGR